MTMTPRRWLALWCTLLAVLLPCTALHFVRGGPVWAVLVDGLGIGCCWSGLWIWYFMQRTSYRPRPLPRPSADS